MSEYDKNVRKKKIYQATRDKEFIPRKPVILVKNDRENKDIDKDKPGPAEKEKTPIIMIKPRETSTIKDSEGRALSPKKISNKENDGDAPVISTIKIAQNENKEKKIIENKPLPTPPSMIHPVKLIDDCMEFTPSLAEYLLDANSNFLVVGVIGAQSVGKSTIMNILAHSFDMSNICNDILTSQDVIDNDTTLNSDDSIKQSNMDHNPSSIGNNYKNESNGPIKPNSFVFKCQDMEQIQTGQTCTSGVDAYVTNSRIIFLDTGAVCGSAANRMMGGIGANATTRSGLEISAFLLAVCHVVILVQDWFVDLNMLRFIQSAEMVKPTIPAAPNSNQNQVHPLSITGMSNYQDADGLAPREHFPHLLFLQNKCTMDDFKPQSVKLMQDLYRKAFNKSKLNIQSGMYLYDSDSDEYSYQIDGMFHNLNTEQCGKPINLFLMPAVTDDYEKDYVYRGHPTVEELASKLRWLVFGANRNQLTNIQLNEKTWLQYCNRTWDNVKKSPFFIEYNRLLP